MDTYDRDEVRVLSAGTKAIFIWGGAFVLLGMLVTGAYALAAPSLEEANARATQRSYAYVNTKQVLLLTLASDYQKLVTQEAVLKDDPEVLSSLEAQKKATLTRMRAEAAQLPPDAVPFSVRPYLQGAL